MRSRHDGGIHGLGRSQEVAAGRFFKHQHAENDMTLMQLRRERENIVSSIAMLPYLSRITLETYWQRFVGWDVDRKLRGTGLTSALVAFGEKRLVEIDRTVAELRLAQTTKQQHAEDM